MHLVLPRDVATRAAVAALIAVCLGQVGCGSSSPSAVGNGAGGTTLPRGDGGSGRGADGGMNAAPEAGGPDACGGGDAGATVPRDAGREGNAGPAGPDASATVACSVDSGVDAAHGTPAAITASRAHVCVLLSAGTVECWGDNELGELGIGAGLSETSSLRPLPVACLTGANALAAGRDHTCAIVANGAVQCWGDDEHFQLGNSTAFGVSQAPVPVTGLTGATALAAGSTETCALIADGTVRCWGDNSTGNLGDGTTDVVRVPVTVVGLSGVAAIAVGGANGADHACALRSDGSVACWGENGATPDTTPVLITGVTGASAIAASPVDTCAIVTGGTVECWTVGSLTPAPVTGITGATTLAEGDGHACAVVSQGAVMCWGDGAGGDLGNQSRVMSSTPVQVVGLTGAMAIAAGADNTCALLSDGGVQCWGASPTPGIAGGGDNFYGEVANGATTPVPVSDVRDAVSVAAGTEYTCATLAGGGALCWGFLGNPFGSPNAVPGVVGVTQVAEGGRYVCLLLADGSVSCMQELPPLTATPQPIAGLHGVAAISVGGGPGVDDGFFHACAALSVGGVQCWGNNQFGELGNGTTTSSPMPVSVAGLGLVTSLATTYDHTCAVPSDGTVACWGNNTQGQLGNGTTTSSSTPVTVMGVTGAVAVAAGGDGFRDHSCALLSNGTVSCWGSNDFGQLGDGTTKSSTTPVAVTGLTGATEITAGMWHTCARLSDGTLRCWGSNLRGGLGDWSQTGSTTPVAVTGISTAVTVSAGANFTCALLSDGTIACWGDNSTFAIGAGTTTPIPVMGL